MITKTPVNFGVFCLLVLIFGAVILGAYFGDRYYMEERVFSGYYIGRAYVGGLTRQEAVSKVSTFEADQIIEKPAALIFEEKSRLTRYEYKPSQAGAVLLPEESVARAIEISHRQGYLGRLYSGIGKKQQHISPVFRIADEKTLKTLIGQVASYIDCDPVDARFIVSWQDGGYNISLAAQKTGKHVKKDETQLLLKNSLEQGALKSALIMDTKQPKITDVMLRQIPDPQVIGSYTTYYGAHDSPNRISNIYLVSSFVNNTYMSTGETFSLLPLIGDFTQERGFKEAYVIMGDELVPEYGGGTCQIATTLYNSVMMADLDVLSRRNHGMYFSIYPLGRDATVYPPSTDFRFKNNTGFPIVIQAHPFRKGLTFRIIGSPTGKTVSFSSPEVRRKYIMVTTKEASSDVLENKLVLTTAFWTTVVRTVKKDGKVLHKEIIKSFYKLHGDKVKVKIRRHEPR